MSLVQIAHGGGGKRSEELIKDVFINRFNNSILNDMEDSAVVSLNSLNLAFTTDSYTVKPILFPGGNIGKLAVCGTVNDLLMRGAKPLFISASFMIEEGFDIMLLESIATSMVQACQEAGVEIITGDTKVVEKGGVDQIFINTSGIGSIANNVYISIKNACPGDSVIISGTIGDHGMAVLSARENITFDSPVNSDCAALLEMVNEMLKFEDSVKVLRDPTRGGVAEVLYNICNGSGVGIEIDEEKLPVKPQVLSACNMLGLDFLQLANEGKLIAVVDRSFSEEIVKTMRKCKYGGNSVIIGTVNDSGLVTMKTKLGTSRIISRPLGELLPRIC